MSDLNDLLDHYRAMARTNRDAGTYFERLTIAYLTADPLQAERYEEVQTYADWARNHGWDPRDIGIDLVAKLRDQNGYAAIQCKLRDVDYSIQKKDIDSFVAVSGKAPFARRVVLDTTARPWSENAEATIRGLEPQVLRIGLPDLHASPIAWSAFAVKGEVVLPPKKQLRPHQREAVEAVRAGLAEADRGKLIMACGTGKTFTSLKIAEDLVGAGGVVLFLVPSLALMAQTVREWTTDSGVPLRSFAVCSDSQVGKRVLNKEDIAEIDVLDLAFPATTEARKVADAVSVEAPDRMTVVFATYQSIQVVSDAQALHGMPEFDLVICDEAHRTTGVTFGVGDESNFVKVHSNDNIRAAKRLYMTATPRIFGDAAKQRAKDANEDVVLASMDDEALYGKTLFYRGFSWAVENRLLTRYKVVVLAMDEALVSAAVQQRLADRSSELRLDDATKIVGCYKALTKADMKGDVAGDPNPMRRALAFCDSIDSSKLVRNEFESVVNQYLAATDDEAARAAPRLRCEIEHVDGTFGAKRRGALLDWLKDDAGDGVCRVLTNARCLSEGVDVPALDAIMFLHPRKSQIDVIQSVGRVMRRAEGKKLGYVILPVGIPAGVSPEQALNNNEKYRVIWQILNALRAHDDGFDATINKASLGQDVSDTIEIVGVTQEQMDDLRSVTAVVDDLPDKTKAEHIGSSGRGDTITDDQMEFTYAIDEFARAVLAKIVKKCGTRDYWEDWAGNIGDIARNHISRLTGILQAPGTEARRAFDAFLAELRDDLNDSVTEADAIEMLAQHIITRPVFEVLFEGHQFTAENPVSRAMQGVLDRLDEANLDKESRDLEQFYASVQTRARGITDPQAKQRLIVELYDKFFRRAFPKTTEKLGIVYTPVEIVDFIIHSVDEVLRDEFGQTLGSEGVHIIDPFAGTGTFITRLLQSGLIAPEEMERKYRRELHANEIVLLAYYIAAVNIEAAYHGLMGGDYAPFEGICLTDTFQMYERGDLIAHFMPDNSDRRTRQRDLDIRVIIGNPPYSKGEEEAGDGTGRIPYPNLDARIRDTYAARSTATNKNSLYDSYIRAIRWGSDRLGEAGVLAFVTNAGWVDGNAADGLRACLAEEFSSVHVFHLRGNQRTSGERSRREGGKIFGSGSRAPIAITVLVKSPDAPERGRICMHDIGDYLSQQEKLKRIQYFGSIAGITAAGGWSRIAPDDRQDWLRQRPRDFDAFITMGDKTARGPEPLFETFSRGVETGRDPWTFNCSKDTLRERISSLIAFYNAEVVRLKDQLRGSTLKSRVEEAKTLIEIDPSRISWTSSLVTRLAQGSQAVFGPNDMVEAVYRPFSKQMLYRNAFLIHRMGKWPNLIPNDSTVNKIIVVKQRWSGDGFPALMVNRHMELQTDGGCQCFPLYLYGTSFDEEDDESRLSELFVAETVQSGRRDAITDAGLAHFRDAYPGEAITKEDVFYYVYGILHSEDYRSRYADNLAKELPRIPRVRRKEDFWAFSRAGRELGNLHVGFEEADPYPVTIKEGDLRTAVIPDPEAFYRVTKMKFGGKRGEVDKTTVIYNANITMQNIPLKAYDYVVNGKPALEWVMERQAVKVDKASGIVNDANRYAIETIGDPAYPLKLFQRVITVSLETLRIVRGLPRLEVGDAT